MNALRSIAALGGALVIVLAGCAATPPSSAPTSDTSADTPLAGVGEDYLCWRTPVDREAFEARTPLAELSANGSAALADATWDDGSPIGLEHEEEWWVGSDTAEQVIILRELGEEDVEVGAPDLVGADYELMAIQYIDDASNWEPGWHVMASTRCALTVDLGELRAPRVQLNPEALPTPDSTVLHLLVTEMDCNSGKDALGRVELVSLDEDATSVSLVVGVRPSGGGTCPSNPPTPFEVTLSEPLGDRSILNAALAEPSPVTPWEPLG